MMLFCNLSAIRDWGAFLSQILPGVDLSSLPGGMGPVGGTGTVAGTPPAASLLEVLPPSAGYPTLRPSPGGLGALPPSPPGPPPPPSPGPGPPDPGPRTGPPLAPPLPTREPPPLPQAVFYLLTAGLVLVAVAYGIVGHLLKDLVQGLIALLTSKKLEGRPRVTVGSTDGSQEAPSAAAVVDCLPLPLRPGPEGMLGPVPSDRDPAAQLPEDVSVSIEGGEGPLPLHT